MSENDNLPPSPSKQTSSVPLKKETIRVTLSDSVPIAASKQTSSVPLKKETIRVTLKAADAPPAVPSATVSLAPPARPPMPSGAPPTPTALATAPPRPTTPAPTIPLRATPTTPAPTIPLRTAGATPTTPAPTIPLRTAGATPTTPAPTIPLRTSGAPTSPSPVPTIRLATTKGPVTPGPTPTSPLVAPGQATVGGAPTLPKATVQLQAPTQPLGSSFPTGGSSATFQIEEEEEQEAHATLYKVLSGVGFAAALVVLVFQLMIAKTWIEVADNPKVGDWMQLFE
ncbi:MAG: hypothetical protein WCS43_08300 [Verrucomicrobiota bacterium]